MLRGLRAESFEIRLLSPVPYGARERFAAELDRLCTTLVDWPEPKRGSLFALWRMRHLVGRVPVPVATDRSSVGARLVARELERKPDLVVFDFPHAVVLAPAEWTVPALIFTHNVESWIFRRHADVARNPVRRAIWRDQWRKMVRFEAETLRRFDTVVAVSDGDADWFRREIGLDNVAVIPTGVDLDFFEYHEPGDEPTVVFTGSMDWLANVDGIEFLMDDVWPEVARRVPGAKMCVIGRNPPPALVQRASRLPWTFTGFVDDVRPHVRGAAAYVIPLRVGGGTRIKAFEAMAMGAPVVSTSIGVEGLPLEPQRHYLRADDAAAFADALVLLLGDAALRRRLAQAARDHVERNFSAQRAARAFGDICLDTLERARRG